MVGAADLRFRAAQGAHGIDQVARRISRAALVAAITVLVGRLALRADPFDESVGEERASDRVVQLADIRFRDQSGVAQRTPDLMAPLATLFAVGAPVIVEADVEAGEIALMLLIHLPDQGFLGPTLLSSPNHDRRAVGVVGAQEDAPVPGKILKSDPNIGLDVFHQMTNMDGTIRIREGSGNKDPSCGHKRWWVFR